MSEEVLEIAEWFDIEDSKHLTAYKKLMETGSWPKGFIPDNVVLNSIWQVSLMSMMTKAYINLKLADKKESNDGEGLFPNAKQKRRNTPMYSDPKVASYYFRSGKLS